MVIGILVTINLCFQFGSAIRFEFVDGAYRTYSFYAYNGFFFGQTEILSWDISLWLHGHLEDCNGNVAL